MQDKEHAGTSGGGAEMLGHDFGAHTYTLGPRFFLDIGKKQLLRCYFAVTGLPEDVKMMAEFDTEAAEFLRADVEATEV